MTKKTTGTLIIALLMIVTMVAYVGLLKKRTLPISPDIEWSYDTKYVDETDPTTQVTVQIDGKKHDVGTYPGSCFERKELEKNMSEIAGIRCWWAGAGDDVGVFQEKEILLIKHRELDEGSAEEGPFIGDFKTLFSFSE
jgi:hypothetical protein